MAVEARHLNLFPPQILSNRELVMNSIEGNGNVFGAPSGYGVVAPLSGTTPAGVETMVPMYSSAIAGALPAKAPTMKSDICLTSVPVLRKRSREEVTTLMSSFPGAFQNQSVINRCGTFTFLGEDISFQIKQQQLEIDRFIAQNTEKVRMEIEERRKRYTRRIAAAAEESILKRLKAKEVEMEKIGNLNHALEERVKFLCVENQIWRELAQTNEATANALRSNLEQVIAQAQGDHHRRQADAADDASSCCGSNHDGSGPTASVDGGDGGIAARNRMCRSCGRQESCVLLLPCRHLCLCTVCGSTLHTCPVCAATKTASVHVNLSC